MIIRYFRSKLRNMLMQTLFNRFSSPYVTFLKEFMDIRFSHSQRLSRLRHCGIHGQEVDLGITPVLGIYAKQGVGGRGSEVRLSKCPYSLLLFSHGSIETGTLTWLWDPPRVHLRLCSGLDDEQLGGQSWDWQKGLLFADSAWRGFDKAARAIIVSVEQIVNQRLG